jgi:hypothetical protein
MLPLIFVKVFQVTSFPLKFSDQNCMNISHISHACYTPIYLILDWLNLIMFCHDYKLRISLLWNYPQPPITFLHLRWDQVRTANRVTSLYLRLSYIEASLALIQTNWNRFSKRVLGSWDTKIGGSNSPRRSACCVFIYGKERPYYGPIPFAWNPRECET